MESEQAPDEKWLTMAQLGELLQIGEDKIRARVDPKKIVWPHRRDGRIIRFTPEDVQDIKDLLYQAPRRGKRK